MDNGGFNIWISSPFPFMVGFLRASTAKRKWCLVGREWRNEWDNCENGMIVCGGSEGLRNEGR